MTAHECQIDWLDTSPRYGNCESLIGAHTPAEADFHLSTKIDDINLNSPDIASSMLSGLQDSLIKLNQDSVDLVYLHQHELDILKNTAVKDGLRLIKEKGLATSIGASVYSLAEMDAVIEDEIFDTIQISGNIFDISNILYIREKALRLRIAIRSIYLQGLILNPHKIGAHIPQHKELSEIVDETTYLASQDGLTLEQVSISFLVNHIQPDQVIFGTNVSSHIQQFREACSISLNKTLAATLKTLSSTPKEWTNPQKNGSSVKYG